MAPESDPAPNLLAEMRDGDWLDAQHFEPLDYIIPGILPPGLTLLAGPPKVGKSWLLLNWGLSSASGGRALGKLSVKVRPVFYLALEDGDRRMQDRCRIVDPRGRIPGLFRYVTRLSTPDLALPTIAAFLTLYGEDKPMVILDTLGKVMPPARAGETTYSRDYRIASAVKSYADAHPGSVIVINHHTRKAEAADFVDTMSGTHGLAGAADTLITVTRARNEREAIINVTGRDVQEGAYALDFDQGVWTLAGDTLSESARAAAARRATAGVGDRMADVITLVVEAPAAVSPAEVADKLSMTKNAAGTYLRRATDAGRLRKLARGLYGPLRPAGIDSEGPLPSTPVESVLFERE